MRERSFASTLLLATILVAAGLTTATAQTSTNSPACVCGAVTAYTAATSSAAGSITIGGQTFNISQGLSIRNSNLITVGSTLCLSAARDTTGALIGPAAVLQSNGTTNGLPPILNVPTTVSVAQGSTLTFRTLGTDRAGGVVTITSCGLPENATFDAATGIFSFTPSASQANQTFTVTFTGTTCFGTQVTRTLTIRVGSSSAETSSNPFFVAPIGPLGFAVGNQDVFNVAAFSPVAGCNVNVTATGLPTGATFDAATGNLTFNPTSDQLGQTFPVTFTATDCNNRTSTFTLPLNVSAGTASAGSICSPVKKIQFNATKIGTSCGTVTVTIFNSGGAPLTITSASLATGTNFQIVGTSPNGASIEAGGQLQFTIAFVPTKRGVSMDTLTIQSNDTNQPNLTIQLVGKGTK